MPTNLIVIVFDTLRYDAVATDLADTPNLDRFAGQATVFDNAWGEGLPTIPFRRALFTGMRSYPWQHKGPERGVFPHTRGWHAIPDEQTTIAEYLYARGYITQLISDVWHMFKPTMNFTRGFVSWDAIRGQEGDTYRFGAPSLGGPDAIDPSRVAPPTYLHQVRTRRNEDEYFVAQLFDRATRFVDDIGDESPYCLWIESFSPHEFWDPPLRFADAYHPPTGINYIVPGTLNDKDPSQEDIARTRALYQGYVTFCDERFGRFIAALEESGTLDGAVVAVVSDHGTELWEQQRFGKSGSRLFPQITHTNLIVRHPDGQGAGTHHDAFVQNHDIAPTLLGLLGVPTPPLDGHDLWPLIVPGPGTDELLARDHVVIGWDKFASVRTRDRNLIIDTLQPDNDTRLFDSATDPLESRNIAAHEPDAVRDLTTKVEALLGAPLPALYQHNPISGPEATPGGLRRIRQRQTLTGETWHESNLI